MAIKSHTVPKRLLRQFSYYEASTRSLRLWRYERGRAPYPKASPETATRIEGHFADPNDALLEATVEKQLAYEIEDPVNQFISNFDDASFVMSELQRRQMTRYVTLLFNRSMARREATRHLMGIRNHALNQFLSNKDQLATVAAQWNLDAHFRGLNFGRLITLEDVANVARGYVVSDPSAPEVQEWYAQGTARAIAGFDDRLFRGQWKMVSTLPESPYILSDAPVIAWKRMASGTINHGVGFHTPDVEVFLPVSPIKCLHILPFVERTRDVETPLLREINMAQAAFASSACFANQKSAEIDVIVQQYISTVKLGQNAFTVFHRNYDNTVYDMLMNHGRWVEPPRRTI